MNSPPKGEGALQQAPTPEELAGRPQNNSGFDFAQPLASSSRQYALTRAPAHHVCHHVATRQEILPPPSFHYARERCVACGIHLRWVPRPRNVERRRGLESRLEQLALAPLTQWERDFIANISQLNGKLPPRRWAKFDELCRKYLEPAP
jgi:hypothetical protein